jgi:MoaA/NifB/PqqE/SkfB family radical SAM enzyme
LFSYSELHIEISSRCVLKCPRCPRTELSEKLRDVLNTDYSLSEFSAIFTPEILIDVKRILFCGDKGDPIYTREFLEIIKYIKQTKQSIRISITTNGSYKSEVWWTELGELLEPHDTITFSVDGWDQKSNNLYRINNNFESILLGIATLSKLPDTQRPFIKWSTVSFRFNQNNEQRILDLIKVQGLKVDIFQLVKSTKIGSIDQNYLDKNGMDELEPISINNAQPLKVYDKSESTRLSKRREDIPWERVIPVGNPWQGCLRGEQIPFIDVDGKFYPCAWFNSGYMPNDFVEKYADEINIRKNGLLAVINHPCWGELESRWLLAPLEICKLKCYKHAQ